MNLAAEILFASRLRRHGIAIFDGLSTIEQRRDRARKGIIEFALAKERAGSNNGKPVTYAQAFEALYGEPL